MTPSQKFLQKIGLKDEDTTEQIPATLPGDRKTAAAVFSKRPLWAG